MDELLGEKSGRHDILSHTPQETSKPISMKGYVKVSYPYITEYSFMEIYHITLAF